MSDPKILKKMEQENQKYKPKPAVVAVYWILRLIVIGVMVMTIIHKNYESTFVCVLVLILFMLPRFVERNFRIELPSTLEIIILVFIFAAEILGELKSYFITYPHWDSMLHTTTGFISAAFGFAMVDLLNRNKPQHFKLSPVFLALVAFCFSMTVGVLWEFFEFSMDYLFHMDMQKDMIIHSFASVTLDPTNSNIPVLVDNITDVAINGKSLGLGGYLDVGLYDTMQDLFVNFVGALTFSVIGYFSAKSGNNKIAKQFVPVVLPEESKAESKSRKRQNKSNPRRTQPASGGDICLGHWVRTGTQNRDRRCSPCRLPRCPWPRAGRTGRTGAARGQSTCAIRSRRS